MIHLIPMLMLHSQIILHYTYNTIHTNHRHITLELFPRVDMQYSVRNEQVIPYNLHHTQHMLQSKQLTQYHTYAYYTYY